jgi:uncharacterized membrane protein
MSTDDDLHRLEHQIGRVLRTGVGLAALAMIVGLALSYAGAPGRAALVLYGGLILLIAIPVTRIATSFVDALRRRDNLLAWSTGLVLLILLVTFLYQSGVLHRGG